MLPGKRYLPEDYLRVVWARKWFLIVPTVVITIGTCIYSSILPDRYRSSARVQVRGQQVPENLVQPTVTDPVAERLLQIQQLILSRSQLEKIIQKYDLYAKQRKTGIMEDIVQQMRARDISITINTPRVRRADASSFDVSFTSENPRIAMQVAEELALLFVNENASLRDTQAQSTSQFLEASLRDAERRLREQEEELARFNRENGGRLPSQAEANMQMVRTIQADLQANALGAQADRDRLATLQATLAGLSARPVAAGPEGTLPVAQQLEAARAKLDEMLLRRTPDHPDVRDAKRVIAELQAKAEAEALSAPLSPQLDTAAIVAASGADRRLLDMQVEIRAIEARLERRAKDDAELRSRLAQYVARLEAMPAVEAKLADITRDYNTTREQYESYLKRAEAARQAERLEGNQMGEQFRIIDSARYPERPISPNRLRMNLLGLAAGLGFGLGLVALLEYRDTTLKTDSDVIVSLSLPVLAVIPAMSNATERSVLRRRRVRWAAAGTSLLIVLVGAGAAAWQFGVIQDWIR